MFTLTPNEQEILNLMWRENHSFSRSEIIQLLPDKSWSDSSIHILLNKLLEKGAIKVDGFVKTHKNYGRTYTAALTSDEYTAMQLRLAAGQNKAEQPSIVDIFTALINTEDIDSDTISELERILEEKRIGLKK